ncbi:MAG TPA: S41 family peptidase [Pirellulales bacterium]|nr:S41 family peptidase [Pirellulales bacterium]
MPRRNFIVIIAAAIVSFACYKVADHHPYGRYFADIMGKIDRLYYQPIDDAKRERLFDSAIVGMLHELDIHSEFMPREEAREFLSGIDQRYGGVGIEVKPDAKAKRITVTNLLVGSPAYNSNVRAGDGILRIDDKAVKDVDLAEVTDMIRGPIGSKVRLSLERAGQKAPIDLSLTRAEIHVDSILGDTRNDDDSWNFHLQGHPEIGYIRIGSEGFSPRGGFGDRTAEEIKAALATLDEKKLKGLILDLRFNGGGRLDAAIDVCSQFLPPGEIVVTTKGRDGRVMTEEKSSGPGTFRAVPMVVLVNSMSASASEIVAACLQDHHRAAVAGQRSYGKGTVQKVLPVEGNQSVLKLTTATYWRPSNKNIHRDKDAKESDEWGVVPDKELAVTLDSSGTETLLNARAERDVVHRAQSHPPAAYVDAQLQKAIDYLEKGASK